MKRFPLPDLLKGFAVFLMVPVHILETFIDFPGRESWFGKLLLFLGGPFGVPVFMLVMGYFVAKNQKPFATNFFRGVKIFLTGFLLNLGLNFHLLWKIQFAGWQVNPLEYIFGVDIFYFAGLAIIFLSLLKTIKNPNGWIALGLAFLVAVFTSVVNEKLMVPERNYIYPFIGGNWSWSYFPLFPWLIYPLAGFAFYHFEQGIFSFMKANKTLTAILVVVIAILVVGFGKQGIETTINLPAYYHHTFWFSIWVFGVVILWSLLLRLLIQRFPHTWAGNGLMWMGKNITVFYIVQWLIIGNIATAIYQTQTLKNFPFWFAGIFGITVLITWVIELLVKKRVKQI
jgi:hypothetical protein